MRVKIPKITPLLTKRPVELSIPERRVADEICPCSPYPLETERGNFPGCRSISKKRRGAKLRGKFTAFRKLQLFYNLQDNVQKGIEPLEWLNFSRFQFVART